MSISKSDSYAAAGVDVTAGYESVNRIKPLVESTYIPGVMGTLGGFGGLFAPDTAGMEKPVLVSGTDGVGTKLKIAFLMDRHDTVGIDCVAMCVNDIVCSGAKPLFFLDYLAVGKNIPERIEAIVSGVTEGCRQAGCALIGGETAEMPGFYPEDEYDLAGFSVGIADQARMLDGSAMEEGDLLIGLSSSGVHSNGFSLVRKVLGVDRETLSAHIPELGCTLGEELIKPTRIYVKTVLGLLERGVRIRAVSHITGGGLYENVPRMMKEGLTARIQKGSFPVPPIFDLIAKRGNIPERDMYNTFNMGVGLVIAIPKDQVGEAKDILVAMGEHAYVIGSVVKGGDGVELV
ncbi:phosphoribosylformylglycinamidine cyclo-ligase [Pseudoflavonifractor sp. BIOML-A6]|nr:MULTISPECIES: phosphoribosylformylglycinamidine cyclo-ligase [unclassified Pseudoflavonifractor]MTQ98117.1 phosphoribosylformylglycinamidine cyclo-ligase [Pseudoflavonifractor sp. BIOML-A16]MTR07541.1 phosphoribosylformylglycinamidine cyclo-ligase [Pseudoflavonifractor sp. BIOML-A15]MTR33414.1 phosphoribosylformylglycinamidine cyclo-ligase [Pseudoflavonifractor sp. BIOML-A14]MTR74439.1 phosphoribosylformylglycinamidine cyclo-ligase [Pseudoflavonifractor sp. BIOML-A18]MTS64634.1 phosphoribos